MDEEIIIEKDKDNKIEFEKKKDIELFEKIVDEELSEKDPKEDLKKEKGLEFKEQKINDNNADGENKVQVPEDSNFNIYEDNEILVYLNKKSSILGHLFIETKSGKKFKDLTEGNISYVFLFSKIFSSIVFEELKCQGTNIIWDYNSKRLEIIPRFQNDSIFKKDLAIQTTEDELKSIAKKLLEKMHKEIGKENPKKSEPEIVNLNDDEKREKAEYILKALRKIP